MAAREDVGRRAAVHVAIERGGSAAGPEPGRTSFSEKLDGAALRTMGKVMFRCAMNAQLERERACKWPRISTQRCTGDEGLPTRMDRSSNGKRAMHKTERVTLRPAPAVAGEKD